MKYTLLSLGLVAGFFFLACGGSGVRYLVMGWMKRH